ncbi:signal transduction histidine kinase [Rhodococcus sp. LBL1]|nr:signal transduction histidine kinase [Rhodococcus sp. LBL1]MDH6683553.1 signal transduction histidine kinase [Rhodococcus sp. LBL2]
MRRRLLAALTVFAAVAVLAFAVPLSLIAATSRTQQLVLARSGDADRFAQLAGAGTAVLDEEVQRYADLYSEGVLVVDARGTPVAHAGTDPADPGIVDAVAAARRNQQPAVVDRLLPWSGDRMLVARPVGTGIQVDGAVVIDASTGPARADIARVWTVIAAGAVVAMGLFTVLALLLSRWVLRPLRSMSAGVADLTATLPVTRRTSRATIARRYGGPPEVRELAQSFDAMADAVADSADAQRQLVADTAHAMRNPLAALTIRLDSLEPSVPEASVAAFRRAGAEVDRLTNLLDGLLTLAVAESAAKFDPARTDAEAEQCDAVAVAHERFDAWYQAYQRAGVGLRLTGGAQSGVAASAEVLAQILDVPLSNSCHYAGAGAHTVIEVSEEPGWVRIEVADDGAGVRAEEIDRLTTRFFRGSGASAGPAPSGSGLGLPIAQALALSRRGTLTVTRRDPHGLAVVVRLPSASPGGAESDIGQVP